MMKCKFVLIALALTEIVTIAQAQNIGVNRASIKWRQVNTDAGRVIFPEGQDSIANRVATLTNELATSHRGTIGPDIKKIDIILQSENTLSNAYVGMGPWRSELFLTPPQNPFVLGANTWADLLAIHEYRHAQQYSNFNVGLSKIGTILLGQYGRAIANNLAVPDWFWEGDAVFNETIHTGQGRGRLPFFFNGYKSLDIGDKQYKWMKLRNGSLKDFVPNHYDLGYLLVAHGRAKYGDDVWKKITQDAAAFKRLVYPMQKAVKRHTGQTYASFTDQALGHFSNSWKNEVFETPTWMTDVQPKNVINYEYPYPTADGGWVALKTTFRQIPTFVKHSADGEEVKIAVKDIGYDDYYSYNNGRIVYTAYQPDQRWDNREYSDIRLLDVKTGLQESVTSKARYFSPDISSDCEKLVAVEVFPGKPATLHVLNKQGEVLQRFSADSSLFYSHPKWLKDGTTIVTAARKPSGDMGWLAWNTEKADWKWLMEPGNRVVGFPVIQGDTMVYTHSSNGADALYAMLLNSGEVIPMKQAFTGIYQGFLQNGKLVGSVFTAEGYRIAAWSSLNSNIKTASTDNMPDLYVSQSLHDSVNLGEKATQTYPSERFKKSFKLFNFHSWIPEPSEPDYRFTLLGENVLSTLSSEVFFNYNTNETSSELGARFVYGDMFIMPFVNGSYTWSRSVRLNADTVLSLNESEVGGGLMLPLNLSGGKYTRRLLLSSAINHENVNWTGIAKDLLKNRNFTASSSRLTYVAQIQRAVQHIYPRFGQTLLVDFNNLIDGQKATQFLASAGLYLPGLHPNHNLVLTAAFQARDTMRQYLFTNSFPFSRGYNEINYPRMWRIGANYHFPLFYPDWGFGNLLYFRRVRANAFYDFTQGKSLRTGLTTPFGTAGGEIFFDMKVWNIQTATLGIRYSYLLNNDLVEPNRSGLFEVVLPINLFGQ
jgi:hypothetical protein